MRDMKQIFLVLIFIGTLAACESQESSERGVKEIGSVGPVNWEQRRVQLSESDSLTEGSTYLSVYSQIYQLTQGLTYDLTATISIRNVSSTDSVFVRRAEYYNTEGRLIRTYVDKPIYVRPLETIEIVIDERDRDGGTGANFIFEWATRPEKPEPYFEGVMISTTGQQGISFTTRGIRR